jgi:uncharacterized protein
MNLVMKSIIATICLSSLLVSQGAFGQTADEKKALRLVLTTPNAKPVYREARQNNNEVQVVFSGLFLFYKGFISSQDSYRCAFYPSCSEYGLLAVKHLGVTRGMLSTFDRLMRCNGLSPEKYSIDAERGVLIDHVDSK